jgi:hypothetical protein
MSGTKIGKAKTGNKAFLLLPFAINAEMIVVAPASPIEAKVRESKNSQTKLIDM